MPSLDVSNWHKRELLPCPLYLRFQRVTGRDDAFAGLVLLTPFEHAPSRPAKERAGSGFYFLPGSDASDPGSAVTVSEILG